MVVERALIEQLHEFETPLVSEALGAMGCPDVHRYYMGGTIQRLIDTPQPMVGVRWLVYRHKKSMRTF